VAKAPPLRTEIVTERRHEGLHRPAARSVAERTFSWFGQNRRLVKISRTLPNPGHLRDAPSIQLSIRRLARA
jgi:hypothetical protein